MRVQAAGGGMGAWPWDLVTLSPMPCSTAGTCILFGDGCGAVVIQAAEEGESCAVLGHKMMSDGTGGKHLTSCFQASPGP